MFPTVSTTTYDLSTMSCPPSVQDCDRRLSDSRVHGDILADTAYSILKNPRNPIKLFADGGSFLACQNLLLALATTSFHSFQGLHEMDIFHISQLRVKLAKFCETGVDDDPSVMIDTENLSYTHERVKKELRLPALHLSANEDTATEVVSQIKDGLQQAFGEDSTINKRLNLVAAVQWCVKDIVARRCKHAKQLVTNYLEIEDCSFIDKSLFEDAIDIFRLSWVLCGDRSPKHCRHCFFRCLKLRGHDKSSDCDCLSPSHGCKHICQGPVHSAEQRHRCQQLCSEKAGHEDFEEVANGYQHLCEAYEEPDRHMCRLQCHLASSRTCHKECVLFIDHPNQHRCTLPTEEHLCSASCLLSSHPISPSTESGIVHPSCASPIIADHTHLCGNEHKCVALCDDQSGVCEISREPLDGDAWKLEAAWP
eukprot:scpid10595/ scgid29452/ 